MKRSPRPSTATRQGEEKVAAVARPPFPDGLEFGQVVLLPAITLAVVVPLGSR